MIYYFGGFCILVFIVVMAIKSLSKSKTIITDAEAAERLKSFNQIIDDLDKIDFSFKVLQSELERLIILNANEPDQQKRIYSLEKIKILHSEMENLERERIEKVKQLEKWK